MRGVFRAAFWTTSHMRNMRASIWVVDPKVEQINEIKPMRDTDVNRVRSVTGVAFAVPLYTGVIQARIGDGTFKPVELIGLDATALWWAVRPWCSPAGWKICGCRTQS